VLVPIVSWKGAWPWHDDVNCPHDEGRSVCRGPRVVVVRCGEALVFVSGMVLRHLGPSWCVNFELVFVLMVLCVVSVVIIIVTTSFLS
jgi:hypothetical protein